ncbi:hypothetical protein F5Y14DRAFT_424851 [Nemania sp. NC0429]|nr:hypothetical protein F5Y14DRAFT_424851 [Nemania sp. NC0429]
MALSIDRNQNFLHQCSKQALNSQVFRSKLKLTSTEPVLPSDHPTIPDPSLFKFGVNPGDTREESRRLPTIAECATHLELLQAFRHIRTEIESSSRLDHVFGIEQEPRTVYRKRVVYSGWTSSRVREPVKLKDDSFKKRREEKWPLYLRIAASRFLSWVVAVEEYFSEPTRKSEQSLHLPPLDVLMVWHALLLNPEWFQSFERKRLKFLSTVPFPWEQIHAAIDSEEPKWPFRLPEEDQAWARDIASLHPDLLAFLAKEDKSSVITSYLTSHGMNREGAEDRGLRPRDIPDVSGGDSDLDPVELKFVEICRVAVSKKRRVEDLVDAVKRQSAFVDKMERQLWIRSPAVEGTLSRAIIRYERFLKLFKLYPKTMLVPTLDIDLVWHTHQCSPAQYGLATRRMAGRFIDHNDKLGTTTLDPAFENTKALYRVRFADEYRLCTCWDCEALRSTIAEENSSIQFDVASVARRAHSEVAFYRAIEIARRKGEKIVVPATAMP